MQGKLYTQTTFESVHAWNHGIGQNTYRLVVDVGDEKPLVISFQKNSDLVHAHWGFSQIHEEDCEFVREVKVPQDVIDTAVAFIEANNALHRETDRLKAFAE